MTEGLRANLPCPCRRLNPTVIHFEAIQSMYESEPGTLRRLGDTMPEEFPERDFEVPGISDACPYCDTRQNVLIRFQNRQIRGIRRKPVRMKQDSVPVMKIPKNIPQSELLAALSAKAGLQNDR